MDPQIKARWIEALRSNKYPQGRFALRTEEGYCCLGVLCEVMGVPASKDGDFWTYDGNGDVLTDPLLKKAELATDDQTELAVKNDGGNNTHCYSFGEIADWIEENL